MFWVLHGFPLEILFFNLRIFCNFNNNNNREKSLKKILVIIILVFAFGCKEDVTSPNKNELVGKWESKASIIDGNEGIQAIITYVLVFSNDGSYSVYDLVEEKEYINEEGTYSISNDSLTILKKECPNIEAKYRVIFDGDGLRIETIKNECESNQFISGIYYKHNSDN